MWEARVEGADAMLSESGERAEQHGGDVCCGSFEGVCSLLGNWGVDVKSR